MQTWQKVSQQMHEQAAQAQSTAAGGDAPGTEAPEADADGDEDVVEGEIVDEGGTS